MSMANLIDAATKSPLTDVYIAVELASDNPTEEWVTLEGGPVVFCFNDNAVVLRQPIGREDIVCERFLMDEWPMWAQKEYPDCRTGLMRIFENICYRKDFNDIPPTVTKVTAFENLTSKAISGLLIELSTGGSIGLDASSYGGLVWFLDGQLPIFRREYVTVMSLHEKVILQQ